MADMDEQRVSGGLWWRHGPPWWRRRDEAEFASRLPWLSTALITVFVLGGSRFAAGQQLERAPLDVFARVLLVVAAGLLLWRRRYPVVVVFGTAAATMLYLGAGYPYGPVFVTFALGCFSAIVAGHRKAAWTALGLLWTGHVLVAHWLYQWLPPSGDDAASWGSEGVVAAWGVAIVALAEVARTRREQWVRERVERAQAARRRADEERLRMARELHDVLAHSISVINVQAGVGLALLDSDPEQARTALTTIKAASKEALGEVRQVLDTLRTPGDAPRAPAPGLDRLPELVEQAASAGLTVRIEGRPPNSRRARISPRSVSSRRRSPMSYGIRDRGTRACTSLTTTGRRYGSVSTTTGPRPAPTRAAAATGWPECGSGPRPWVARSRPGHVPTEASGCSPYCPSQ